MAGILSRFNEVFSLLVLALFSFFAISIIVDVLFFGGQLMAQNLLNFAEGNEAALSIIFSFLLLLAYLMQYQSQRAQRAIMDRQESLMSAGYTPIVGVVSRKWGIEKADEEERTDLTTDEANKLYLKLSNNGNSTARDLRAWFGILYDDPSNLPYRYRSCTVPLRRTNEGIWWPTDVGGAISDTNNTPVEFVTAPKVEKVDKTTLPRLSEKSGEVVHVHDALQDLKENGVDEIMLGVVLKYRNATGDTEDIDIAAYRSSLSALEESNWYLYRAMEDSEEQLKEIKAKC